MEGEIIMKIREIVTFKEVCITHQCISCTTNYGKYLFITCCSKNHDYLPFAFHFMNSVVMYVASGNTFCFCRIFFQN